MPELKEVLFEETFYQFKECLRLNKELGEYDRLVAIEHAKFCTLYDLIEKAGLEEEYQKWKGGNENI